MKRLLILSLLLCSCEAYQKAGTDKHGQPYAINSAGWWNKTDGLIQKADNGPIHLEQMAEHSDGVAGPQALGDSVVSAAASYGFFKRDVNDSNNTASVSKHKTTSETKVKLKQLDNEALGIQGSNTVNEINAKK